MAYMPTETLDEVIARSKLTDPPGYGFNHGIDHDVEIELGCVCFHDRCWCPTIHYDAWVLFRMEDGHDFRFEGAD